MSVIHFKDERMEEAYKRRALAMAERLHKVADDTAAAARQEDWSKLISIGLDVIELMPRFVRRCRTIERRKS